MEISLTTKPNEPRSILTLEQAKEVAKVTDNQYGAGKITKRFDGRYQVMLVGERALYFAFPSENNPPHKAKEVTMDRETRGILNKRAYKYFVILAADARMPIPLKSRLESGWEYKSDANDRVKELAECGFKARVLMRAKAKAVLEGRANPRRMTTFSSGLDYRTRQAAKPTVAKMLTPRGPRYVVIGTPYGHVHTTSGDIRTWTSASGARKWLRANYPKGQTNPRRKSRKNPPDALTVCREVNRRGELTEALVRKIFHEADESHLWPISGRFNATKRAIGRLTKAQRDGLVIDTPYEYASALDAEISNIVNDPRSM